MRRFALLMLIPALCACATGGGDKVRKEVAAVVQDESQRDKVVDAIQKGATPAEAMDKVSDGPKHQKVGPQ